MQADTEAAGKPADVGLWLAGQGVLFDFYLFFSTIEMGRYLCPLGGRQESGVCLTRCKPGLFQV